MRTPGRMDMRPYGALRISNGQIMPRPWRTLTAAGRACGHRGVRCRSSTHFAARSNPCRVGAHGCAPASQPSHTAATAHNDGGGACVWTPGRMSMRPYGALRTAGYSNGQIMPHGCAPSTHPSHAAATAHNDGGRACVRTPGRMSMRPYGALRNSNGQIMPRPRRTLTAAGRACGHRGAWTCAPTALSVIPTGKSCRGHGAH